MRALRTWVRVLVLNDPAARPDGTYIIYYGAAAATADEWGQRYLDTVRCMSIAIEARFSSPSIYDRYLARV
jgi:hypothetical protein